MDLRRLFEHYADIERAGQDEKARHGRRRTRREIERERLEGRVGGSTGGHGHLEHDTKKPKAIWSALQPPTPTCKFVASRCATAAA